MKIYLSVLSMLVSFTGVSQPSTEVYLFDISSSAEGISLMKMRNISSDPGYDNQPSFASNDRILFAANNHGQTDIADFNISLNKKGWFHKGSVSSQYSPQKLPSSQTVLSVHLDSTGYQRLYTHSPGNATFEETIPNLRVAYFAMFNDHLMLATVLADDGMDLIISNLKTKKTDTLLRGVGRSVHKVPNTPSMSYTVVNEEGNLDIYLLDVEDNATSYFICQLPIGIQDYAWLNDHQMILASDTKLYRYDTLDRPEWTEVASLNKMGFKDISRIAVSPDGKKLALVALPDSE